MKRKIEQSIKLLEEEFERERKSYELSLQCYLKVSDRVQGWEVRNNVQSLARFGEQMYLIENQIRTLKELLKEDK